MKLIFFLAATVICFLQISAKGILKAASQGVISGCPLFGCSPGGSFSFDLRFPRRPVHIQWESEAFAGQSEQPFLGCVGNSKTIVCPISSKATDGYVGFNVTDGGKTWSDSLLHNPPLPLMDIYGDIIGCDGQTLLQYLEDGSLIKPVIQLFPPMKQIFSLNLANNGIFLLTSAFGVVTTYFSNGVPGGTTTLYYKVKNESGVFYPISSPVIRGHRTYFLAKFLADNTSSEVNGLRRLFAIDMNDEFLRKIAIIWFVDLGFSRENNQKISPNSEHGESDFGNSAKLEGAVLAFNGILFVTAGNSMFNSSAGKTDFWVLEDEGNLAFIIYTNSLSMDDLCIYDQTAHNKLKLRKSKKSKKLPFEVKQKASIVTFQKPVREQKPQIKTIKDDGLTIWGSNKREGILFGFGLISAGIQLKTQINLIDIIQAQVQITSKVMVVRNQTDLSGVLVFGINILNKTTNFINLLSHFQTSNVINMHYVVAIKPVSDSPPYGILLWILPVPGDYEVRGQIIGIPTNSEETKDFLVAYTSNGNSTKLFAIN